MGELDHKESWAPKNRCFWTVVLEKTLKVPWTARRSSQSILKEINLEQSLFGHLMQRSDSLEKTLLLGKIEGGRRTEGQRMRPTRWTQVWASSVSWWWTGKPGMLQAIGSQRVAHDWAVDLNWTLILKPSIEFYMEQSLPSIVFMEISKEVITPKFLLKVFWDLDAILILFTLSILILKSL